MLPVGTQRVASLFPADRYGVSLRAIEAVLPAVTDLEGDGGLREYSDGEKSQHLTMPCWLRDVVREADLPEDEIGLAAAHVQGDRAVRVVDDVALPEVRRLRPVVVSRAEIESA